MSLENLADASAATKRLKELGTKDAVARTSGSPNLLAFNGGAGSGSGSGNGHGDEDEDEGDNEDWRMNMETKIVRW